MSSNGWGSSSNSTSTNGWGASSNSTSINGWGSSNSSSLGGWGSTSSSSSKSGDSKPTSSLSSIKPPSGNGWGAPGTVKKPTWSLAGSKKKVEFNFGTGQTFETNEDPNLSFAKGIALSLPSKPKTGITPKPEEKSQNKEDTADDCNEEDAFVADNDAGLDDDDKIISEKCVLYVFVPEWKEKDTVHKAEWSNRGQGTFMFCKNKTTQKHRIIIRREEMGAISVNSFVDDKTQPKLAKKKVLFTFIDGKDEKQPFKKCFATFKNEEIAKKVFEKIDEVAKSA